MNRPQAQDVEHHAGPQHQPGKTDIQPAEAQQTGAEYDQQNGGQEKYNDNGELGQDGGDNHTGVVGEMVARRRLQDAGAVVGLEDGLGDHLHHKQQADEKR